MSNREPQAAPAPPRSGPPAAGGTPGPGREPASYEAAQHDGERTEQMPRVEAERSTPAPAAAAPAAGGEAPPGSGADRRSSGASPVSRNKAGAKSRRARLRLVRVDPWSVMKLAFALSIALAIVAVVAVTIVWAVLGAAGVWDAINSSVATVLSDNASAFDITDYVGFGRIIGLTLLISAVDVILITAIATIGAFLYNLAASLLGGLEVTLAEDR